MKREQVVDRAAAANHVKDVRHDRGPRIAGSRGDRPGAGDIIDSVDKAQKLHRRNHSELRGRSRAAPRTDRWHGSCRRSPGGAGDDVRAPELDRLRHPAPAVVEDALVLGPVRSDPTMKRDHADDLEPGVGDRPFQFGELAPVLEVGRDLVVPGLDRASSRPCRRSRSFPASGVGRIVLVLRQ